MNETLCRALLQARLTEEDVAARLQVDPKTVRRWLEGRVPYLRHRWALAALLGLDETDLWPHLRRTRSRPEEVQAIYPHLDAVPEDVWLRLFRSAEREIGILADTAQPIAGYPRVLPVLVEKAMRTAQDANLPVWPSCSDSWHPLCGQTGLLRAAEWWDMRSHGSALPAEGRCKSGYSKLPSFNHSSLATTTFWLVSASMGPGLMNHRCSG